MFFVFYLPPTIYIYIYCILYTVDTVVLKTLKHYEVLNLRKALDSYAAHTLTDYTCIASVIGLYRVKIRKKKMWGWGAFPFPVNEYKYFIACKNVYPRESWNVVRKYDLKGSTGKSKI